MKNITSLFLLRTFTRGFLLVLFAHNYLLAQPALNDPFFLNPGTGFNSYVRTTSIQADGKIIVGGDFWTFNGTLNSYIARLNTNGSLDGGFNSGNGFVGAVSTTAIQPDGKIIVGGWFISYNGTARNHINRLNPDGSLDEGFNPGTGFDLEVRTTVLQPDGKIIVAGNFTSFRNGKEPYC